MAVKWERNLERPRGQAHVFEVPPEGGPAKSLCRTVTHSEVWGPSTSGLRCMSCRRRVDPDGAPKVPSWRMP